MLRILMHPSQSSGFRSPFERWSSVSGRRSFSMQPSIQSSTQSSIQPSTFPIDSAIGAFNVRPLTDATQSRPYLRSQPITQHPILFF